MVFKKPFILVCLALAALFAVPTFQAWAQTSTVATSATNSTSSLQAQLDSNDQQIAALNQQISQYQAEIQQAGADKKTLQAAINALDLQKKTVATQVTLTQAQINGTQLQIQQISGQIATTQQTIAQDEAAIAAELVVIQKENDRSLLTQMLSDENLAATWSDANATLEAEDAIVQKAQTLHTQELALTDAQTASQQKQSTLTSQKQSLASQQQSLVATEQSKTQLLTQTNAQESQYEKLLAAAQAQLQSFSTFTQNAGGSGLLGNLTVCDSWGCYYSQRDSAWGTDKLDGTKYTLASDGCLVTAMAMVMTHYGYRSVTPVTINSNPSNFAAYYPASLLLTINVAGVTATRKTTAIDATLAAGTPVIVGLNALGGTHYVVLISGSKGNYIMRDPYITNGKDVPFSDHYTLKEIFGITKVVID